MKPDWKDIDARFKFLAGDQLGYTLWSHEPVLEQTSLGGQWRCDDYQSFGNIPDYDSSRKPFLERRP